MSFRIRVGGWRVIYAVKDDMLLILVIKIGHGATSTVLADQRRRHRGAGTESVMGGPPSALLRDSRIQEAYLGIRRILVGSRPEP